MTQSELIHRLKKIRDDLQRNNHKEKKTGRVIVLSVLARPIAMINKLIVEIEKED